MNLDRRQAPVLLKALQAALEPARRKLNNDERKIVEDELIHKVIETFDTDKYPPAETLIAIKHVLHHIWEGRQYAYNSAIDGTILTPRQFELLTNWITPQIGTKVVAVTMITEGGPSTPGNPAATDMLDSGWIHAQAGEKGVIESLNDDRAPTVRFDRTGTATILDWCEIEW